MPDQNSIVVIQTHFKTGADLSSPSENISVPYGLVRTVEHYLGSVGIIAGFAAMIPHAVSTLEIGLPTNNDILLDGPFDEPDEMFLSIQRNAIGQDMT